MRVAYVLPFDISRAGSLYARLVERLDEWTSHGVEATVLVCVGPRSALGTRQLRAPHQLQILAARNSALATFGVLQALRQSNPDVVYMRYGLPYPGLVRVAKKFPTVLEIHSDDTVENQFRPMRYRIAARIWRESLIGAAAGAVMVDPDLMDAAAFGSIEAARKVVIPNGIKIVESASFAEPRRRSWTRPRLVMAVGAAEPWQGVDKLEKLAHYSPSLDFHIVGLSDGDLSQRLPNITAHGPLSTADFYTLMDEMDIGVGSLALERVDRPHPSPLKVRDYISAGLPCALAHSDPDLPLNDHTVLNLGYGFIPDQVAAARLAEFAYAVAGSRCSVEVAASVRLEEKEAARILLLREVARRAPAP